MDTELVPRIKLIGYRSIIAFTLFLFSRVTIPPRRYQIPSFVRHTSSASIRAPVVNKITGWPPGFFPNPAPLVDTGAAVVLECEVVTRLAGGFELTEGLGEGDGDGDGVPTGAGAAIVGGGTATGA